MPSKTPTQFRVVVECSSRLWTGNSDGRPGRSTWRGTNGKEWIPKIGEVYRTHHSPFPVFVSNRAQSSVLTEQLHRVSAWPLLRAQGIGRTRLAPQ